MKIRKGFVSNSSSSSFLLFFNKKISDEDLKKRLIYEERFKIVKRDLDNNLKSIRKDKKEVKKLLKSFFESLYGYMELLNNINETFVSITNEQELLSLFKEDLKTIKPIFYDVCKLGLNVYKKKYSEITQSERDIYHEKREFLIDYMVDLFLKHHKSGYLCFLSYSDNDGKIFSDLEHSGCLFNVPDICFQLSQH